MAAPVAGAGGASTAAPDSPAGSMQVTVPPETIAEFKALKTRRKYRFMTLRIDPTAFTVSVDKSAPASATGADFLKALPGTSARYCIYDHEYKTKDGRTTDKLFFILWTPSGAVGKDNMLYASQRRALDGVITGVDDAHCSSTQGVAKLLGISSAIEEDEEEWDPDA